MLTAIFNDDDMSKTAFYFADDDRSMFDDLEYGSILEIAVKDEKGDIVTIPFSVTRNTFLGSQSHFIYGQVLGTADDIYREIKIRLRKGDPGDDTIDVFPQAPYI